MIKNDLQEAWHFQKRCKVGALSGHLLKFTGKYTILRNKYGKLWFLHMRASNACNMKFAARKRHKIVVDVIWLYI